MHSQVKICDYIKVDYSLAHHLHLNVDVLKSIEIIWRNKRDENFKRDLPDFNTANFISTSNSIFQYWYMSSKIAIQFHFDRKFIPHFEEGDIDSPNLFLEHFKRIDNIDMQFKSFDDWAFNLKLIGIASIHINTFAISEK